MAGPFPRASPGRGRRFSRDSPRNRLPVSGCALFVEKGSYADLRIHVLRLRPPIRMARSRRRKACVPFVRSPSAREAFERARRPPCFVQQLLSRPAELRHDGMLRQGLRDGGVVIVWNRPAIVLPARRMDFAGLGVDGRRATVFARFPAAWGRWPPRRRAVPEKNRAFLRRVSSTDGGTRPQGQTFPGRRLAHGSSRYGPNHAPAPLPAKGTVADNGCPKSFVRGVPQGVGQGRRSFSQRVRNRTPLSTRASWPPSWRSISIRSAMPSFV